LEKEELLVLETIQHHDPATSSMDGK